MPRNHHRSCVSLLFLLSFGCLLAKAQEPFVLTHETFPWSIHPSSQILFFDADGDGNDDLLQLSAPPQIAFGDGSGNYLERLVLGITIAPTFTTSAALDMDGDGDLDLFIGSLGTGALLENRGGRIFREVTPSPLSLPRDVNHAVATLDLNGDGSPDLVTGRNASPFITVLINDGSGRFVDETATRTNALSAAPRLFRTGDFDGDGDTDLYANGLALEQLLVNDGSGSFRILQGRTGSFSRARFADVDGNGTLDLITYSNRLVLLLNAGNLNFIPAPLGALPPLPPALVDFDLGDVNGDGDPDLVLATQDRRLALLEGAPGERFTQASTSQLPRLSTSPTSVTLHDDDQDGDLDLHVTGTPFAQVFRADGTGSFQAVRTGDWLPEAASSSPVELVGDLDGDGDLDAFAAGDQTARDGVLVNDGAGRFDPLPVTVTMWTGKRIVPLDLEGDGDLDIFVCRDNQQVLYRNDGNLTFQEVSQTAAFPSPHTYQRTDAASGDFDGDGLDDLFVTSHQTNRMYLNAGNGTFVDGTLWPSNLPAIRSVAVADLNTDGLDDILLGEAGRSLTWLRNSGNATFTAVSIPACPDTPKRNVHVADLNGDSHLDIFVVGRDVLGQTSPGSQVLFGDGNGGFTNVTRASLGTTPRFPNAIALLDFDEDGDLDLYFALTEQHVPRSDVLLENDGSGVFSERASTLLRSRPSVSSQVTAGDIDGDGDADLLVNTFYSPPWVLRNTHRHLAWTLQARTGRAFALDARGPAAGWFLLMASLSSANVPVPSIGQFRLGSTGFQSIAPAMLDAQGRGTFRTTIPAVPQIAGTPLFFQTLLANRNVSELSLSALDSARVAGF